MTVVACLDTDVHSYVRKIKKYSDDWAVGLCGDVSIGDIFIEYCKYNMPGEVVNEDIHAAKSSLFDIVNFASAFMSDVKTNPVFSTDDNKPSFVFLMVYNGRIYTYDSTGHVNEHRLNGAMGSGYKWAVAAMRLGKTPKEAVKFTIKNCVTCGGKIDSFTMPAKRSRR